MGMIYDCFSFFNELDLLEIRSDPVGAQSGIRGRMMEVVAKPVLVAVLIKTRQIKGSQVELCS